MKAMVLKLICVLFLISVSVSCRDKSAEKKIAELESRLAELEKNKRNNENTASTPITNQPSAAPSGGEPKPEGPLPVMEFNTVDHDFGTINEGKKVAFTYVVKNTGTAPLIIQSVQPTCGCTTPDWTKSPIPVGEKGFIKAVFDSQGRTGVNNKSITVMANTWPKSTVLKFKAVVVAKPAGASGSESK